MRVLIVDDSRAVRFVLSKYLRELGFDVFEAVHGKDALVRLLALGATDLALVDWNMPEMNGLELVKAVRANPGYDSMRIMMVTTESEIESVLAALEAGANEYVMKPFTKEAIVSKLALLGLAEAEACA